MEFFWSVFSVIWTEYWDLLCKSPYSVWMPKNMDQENPEYGHISNSETLRFLCLCVRVFVKSRWPFLQKAPSKQNAAVIIVLQNYLIYWNFVFIVTGLTIKEESVEPRPSRCINNPSSLVLIRFILMQYFHILLYFYTYLKFWWIWKSLRFCDDFREKRSWLILLSLLHIRSEVWRWSWSLRSKILTLFRMGIFGTAHGWGDQKGLPP